MFFRRPPADTRSDRDDVRLGPAARRTPQRAEHRGSAASGVRDDRRDRPRAVAHDRLAPQLARVGDRRRVRATARRLDARRLRPAHVACQCDHTRSCGADRTRPGRPAWHCSPPLRSSLLWLASARGRVAREHAHARARLRRDLRRRGRHAARRAQDLALLPDLRHSRGPLPRTRQLPGGPEGRGGAPHLAHEHGSAASVVRDRLRPRLPDRRGLRRERVPHARDAHRAWSASAATSTTGTTPARSSRSGPPTSPRSTRATWPATCVALRVAMLEISERPLLDTATLDGIADTVRLALEDLQAARSVIAAVAAALDEVRTALEEVIRRISLDTPPDEPRRVARFCSRGSPRSPEALNSRMARPCARRSRQRRTRVRQPRSVRRRGCGGARATRPHRHLRAVGARGARRRRLACRRARSGARTAAVVRAEPRRSRRGPRRRARARSMRLAAGDEPRTRQWAARVAAGIRGGRATSVALLAELRLGADIAREMWNHTDFAMLFDESRHALLDRLQRRRGPPRRLLLRHARERVPPRELPRGRQGRDPAGALVPARPRYHAHRRRDGARELEREHVRVPHAAARDEELARRRCSIAPTRASCAGRSSTARQRGVPWGVSESAFNAKDVELTYQYQAFGVPGLGLKRGLSADVVDRAVRHGARAHGRAARGARQHDRARRPGRRGPVRLLRGDRLHAGPRAGRQASGRSCARTWRTTRA